MQDLTQLVMALQDPANSVADSTKALERVIVFQPSQASDIIPVVSHWKQFGTLKVYDGKEITEILNKQKQAIYDLSNAFKRIVLFELAGYIGAAYVKDLPDEPSTADVVVAINRAQISLMNDPDYSQAHNAIVQASDGLKGKTYLPVNGRADSLYLVDVGQPLKLCEPHKNLEVMNIGFAGRQIKFSINEFGVHTQEMQRNTELAEFTRTYPSLFKPVSGYILFRSPETVDYANGLLDKFARLHPTLDPIEVSISGRSPLEFFRLTNKM